MSNITQQLNGWIELSEANFAHNMRIFRKLVGEQVEISVMVKSNAYGHGWLQIALLSLKYGANSFCVHSLDEALQLRHAGFENDILIMGHVPLSSLEHAVQGNYRLVLYNKESLLKLIDITKRLEKPVRLHLKIETGMHRQGIEEDDLSWFMVKLKESRWLILEAIYTHFANIDDPDNHYFASYQINQFHKLSDIVTKAGFSNLKKHTANSAAILLYPNTYFDMVRLGISLYGLWPSRETFIYYNNEHQQKEEDMIRPLMTWKTRISQIKYVSKDHYIGYGCTYKTTKNSRIAVLPVGYADGYDRALSNQGYVLIRGKRAPVTGRICMNLMMVDVSDIPDLKLEDEVVLLGKQASDEISADYIANLIGTINYEIVSRINWEIERIIV